MDDADILNHSLIPDCPPSAYVIPEFVTLEQETELLDHIYNVPKPKWTQLNNRRLQNWGGLVSNKGLIPDGPLPQFLDEVIERIMQVEGVFDTKHRPNHVLVNEYVAGQGILPHVDGPAFTPTITTVSLGSYTMLDFYRTPEESSGDCSIESRFVGSILVPRRSLLILRDDMYAKYMHAIVEREQDDIQSDRIFNWASVARMGAVNGETWHRGTRLSLTIRNVPRVGKLDVGRLLRR